MRMVDVVLQRLLSVLSLQEGCEKEHPDRGWRKKLTFTIHVLLCTVRAVGTVPRRHPTYLDQLIYPGRSTDVVARGLAM